MRGVHLLDGAGHWVQQEQAAKVTELLLNFCSDNPHPPRTGGADARTLSRNAERGKGEGQTFSITSICAPSGASRKATWRPLLLSSSSTLTPFLRTVAIVEA